jgi:hypothetical protein
VSILRTDPFSYNPTATPVAQRGWLTLGSFGIDHYVTDPQEMMSFVARSRSKAVGALEGVGGPIQNHEVNLQADFGFTDIRSEHSAEFNRPIQQVGGPNGFYSTLLIKLFPPQ